jgi:PIN domain
MSAMLRAMTKKHYIFVDMENVPGVDLDLVAGKPVQVVLLAGKGQTRVDWNLAESIHRHCGQVRLVKADSSGPNALDFVLAWEMGTQGAADPAGSYHVVSKDRGFDAMIAHMRSRGMEAARHPSFASVPALECAQAPAAETKAPAPKARSTPAPKPKPKPPAPLNSPQLTPKARAEEVRRWLAKYPENRPKRKLALVKLIKSNIAGDLSDGDLKAVLERLVARRIITISDTGAVTYPA